MDFSLFELRTSLKMIADSLNRVSDAMDNVNDQELTISVLRFMLANFFLICQTYMHPG